MKIQNSTDTYSVARRWLPWERRLKAQNLNEAPSPDGFAFDVVGDDPISLVIGTVFLAILILIGLPTILLFIGIALELALLIALLPVILPLRVLFLSWPLEVKKNGEIVHSETVRGWRASQARMYELALIYGSKK